MEYKKNTNFQNIYAYSSPKESARFSRNEITRVTNILFSGCFRGEKKKTAEEDASLDWTIRETVVGGPPIT